MSAKLTQTVWLFTLVMHSCEDLAPPTVCFGSDMSKRFLDGLYSLITSFFVEYK